MEFCGTGSREVTCPATSLTAPVNVGVKLLPFSSEQFFHVFEAYNRGVWPAQWLLMPAGFLCLASAVLERPRSARIPLLLLAALWLWMAFVYQLGYFSAINPAARAFAAVYILGAVLFVWRAFRSPAPRLELRASVRSIVGISLAAFGLVGYQLVNPVFGHRFPAAPGFGLPCPTTIFTLGILSLLQPWPTRSLLVVPILWSLIGVTAAFVLGVPQDYILGLAGLWGLWLVLANR